MSALPDSIAGMHEKLGKFCQDAKWPENTSTIARETIGKDSPFRGLQIDDVVRAVTPMPIPDTETARRCQADYQEGDELQDAAWAQFLITKDIIQYRAACKEIRNRPHVGASS